MFTEERKWLLPLILVAAFVFILSYRQLSDPDLGFHLKYGEWISMHRQVPQHDLSTYTVSGNEYIDLQWLFQVILFQVYRAGGYPMVSLFVCITMCSLFLILLYRNRLESVPLSRGMPWILAVFIIADPRIAPRPEIFTFLLMTLLLLVLDSYIRYGKNRLYFLPLIMLAWSNLHALFILGIVIMIIYLISRWIQEKNFDKRLLFWVMTAIVVCLVNPYGIKGLWFPLALLTRFDPTNVFNQHIQEFMPFFSQAEFYFRDYLFLAVAAITLFLVILHLKSTAVHEIALIVLFAILGFSSIRNMSLFILIAVPVAGRLTTLTGRKLPALTNKAKLAAFLLLVIIPAWLIPRVLTNAYYLENNSFNKTGLGLDQDHQPVMATRFMTARHLDARILNSVGFGGWLSWSLPQPVFIDGRLEVMQEPLYQEVTDSWRDGLPALIAKYRPQLIIYNYLKYYPWTEQLGLMYDWRLIYADGIAAIFASRDYRQDIPGIHIEDLPEIRDPGSMKARYRWFDGFLRQPEYRFIDTLHLSLLKNRLSAALNRDPVRVHARYCFSIANKKYRKGDFNGAVSYYDSAIILDPRYPEAYNNRGILRVEQFHDLAGALRDFKAATEIAPSYSDAWTGCGSVRILMHDTSGALKDWSRARALGSRQAARLLEMSRTAR
jgi:tetratricopeptide (TPR) repeat protein